MASIYRFKRKSKKVDHDSNARKDSSYSLLFADDTPAFSGESIAKEARLQAVESSDDFYSFPADKKEAPPADPVIKEIPLTPNENEKTREVSLDEISSEKEDASVKANDVSAEDTRFFDLSEPPAKNDASPADAIVEEVSPSVTAKPSNPEDDAAEQLIRSLSAGEVDAKKVDAVFQGKGTVSSNTTKEEYDQTRIPRG